MDPPLHKQPLVRVNNIFSSKVAIMVKINVAVNTMYLKDHIYSYQLKNIKIKK